MRMRRDRGSIAVNMPNYVCHYLGQELLLSYVQGKKPQSGKSHILGSQLTRDRTAIEF